MSCVLDGEFVCLAPDGGSLFHRLLFRRDWPHFVAFDVLTVDGEDQRDRSIHERKRRLRGIMPRVESRLATWIVSSAAARSCSRRDQFWKPRASVWPDPAFSEQRANWRRDPLVTLLLMAQMDMRDAYRHPALGRRC